MGTTNVNKQFQENPMLRRMPTNEMEWQSFLHEMAKFVIDTDVSGVMTDAAALPTDASAVYAKSVPASFAWTSDPAGAHVAGNPAEDILTTFYDRSGTAIATRTLRGTMTSATGNIAVTAVSNTGLTTAYVLTDDGTTSVLATITVTLEDGATFDHTTAWSSVDISVETGTPATGGGK